MSKPKIELIIVRDPDGDTSVTVFIDGKEATNVEEYVVDAGAGHSRADWEEHKRYCLEAASSERVREDVADAFDNAPGSEYITDDDGGW